jgi:hypothetical protein
MNEFLTPEEAAQMAMQGERIRQFNGAPLEHYIFFDPICGAWWDSMGRRAYSPVQTMTYKWAIWTPPKIQAKPKYGEIWKDRAGNEWEIYGVSPSRYNSEFPISAVKITGIKISDCFTENGCVYIGKKSLYDLIEKVRDAK